MTSIKKLTRRSFVLGSAGAGLSLGLRLPLGISDAQAQTGFTDEINAWVVVRPDEQVIIRIARSEMG